VLLLTKEKKFADARASYDKGLKIATKLTNADQTNVQYRRDLSVSHEKLGDALALEDRHDDARKAYQDSFNIRKKLADANPKNDEYQLGLQMIAEKIEKLNAKLPILTPTTTPVGGLQ
jgi:tetratricopeptide (TPR) repeat protein